MANAKVKSFQNAWLENYVIRITARCPMTIEVLSAVCQFCDSFGAEDNNNPYHKQKGLPMYVILRNHDKVII
jgi:hypothetical protein